MKDKRSPSQLEALWKESDMSGGRKVDAMVVIMRTSGCCWVSQGGCTMCGYREASLSEVTEQDLMSQLDDLFHDQPDTVLFGTGGAQQKLAIQLQFINFQLAQRVQQQSQTNHRCIHVKLSLLDGFRKEQGGYSLNQSTGYGK